MRTKHPFALTAIGALLLLLTAGRIMAQQQPDAAQLEAFRGELIQFYSRLQAFTQSVADDATGHPTLYATFKELSAKSEQAGKQLTYLPLQDLMILQREISKNPSWLETPETLGKLFTPERRKFLKELGEFRMMKMKGSLTPEMVNPTTCSRGPGTPLGITDAIIAEAVVIALETVMESLPDDFLSFEGKVVAAIAHGAGKAAWLVLRGLNDVYNECDGNIFQYDTINKLNSALAKLDQILAKLADILAKLTSIEGKIDILDQKVDAMRGVVDEIQAREVEESIDWCRPIASILLPNSRGGRLEQARDLVKNFLNQALASGPPAFPVLATTTATTHLNSGLGQLTFVGGTGGPITGGDFKTAFQYFCKAYAALVKTP